MANKTRSALRSEVLTRVAETAGFYTVDNINTWLQDGVDDVSLHVEPLVARKVSDVTAGSYEYTLPSDYISLKQVQFKNSASNWVNLIETQWDTLYAQDPNWEDSTNTADPPSKYYERPPNVIGLWPIPKTSRTGALRLLYSYRPIPFASDDSTTGLPDWLDKAVVLYAVARCYMKGRDEQRALAAMQEYRGQTGEAVRKINKHRREHAPRFVPNQRGYRKWYGQPRWTNYLRVSEA